MTNEDFARRGGRCRRVLTMPGKSSYQTMRYSGSYQLERSAEELRQLELDERLNTYGNGAFRASVPESGMHALHHLYGIG